MVRCRGRFCLAYKAKRGPKTMFLTPLPPPFDGGGRPDRTSMGVLIRSGLSTLSEPSPR
jgi:hypothetical protein